MLFKDDKRLLLVALVVAVVVVDAEAGEFSLLDIRLLGCRKRFAFKLFARTAALKRTNDSCETDLFDRKDFIELCIEPPNESIERSTSDAVLTVHCGPVETACFDGDERLSLDIFDLEASAMASRLFNANLEFRVELSSLEDILTTGSIPWSGSG